MQFEMPPPHSARHGTGALVIKAILPVWRAGAARPDHEFGKTSTGGPAQVTVMIAHCQESEPEAFEFTFLHRGMSRDVYCGMSQMGPTVLKIHSDDWSDDLTEADARAGEGRAMLLYCLGCSASTNHGVEKRGCQPELGCEFDAAMPARCLRRRPRNYSIFEKQT